MFRRGRRHAAEIRKDVESSPKASGVPPLAKMMAPIVGPMTPASCHERLVSELALGSSSGGTICGTDAV
jgi:hypothetical protein